MARAGDYTGHQADGWTALHALELVLTTRSGGLALSGMELARAFERRTDTLYELAYRAPDFAGSCGR